MEHDCPGFSTLSHTFPDSFLTSPFLFFLVGSFPPTKHRDSEGIIHIWSKAFIPLAGKRDCLALNYHGWHFYATLPLTIILNWWRIIGLHAVWWTKLILPFENSIISWRNCSWKQNPAVKVRLQCMRRCKVLHTLVCFQSQWCADKNNMFRQGITHRLYSIHCYCHWLWQSHNIFQHTHCRVH